MGFGESVEFLALRGSRDKGSSRGFRGVSSHYSFGGFWIQFVKTIDFARQRALAADIGRLEPSVV